MSFRRSVAVRKECVMSPWLFNVCMDGVIREHNRTQRSQADKKWERYQDVSM